MEEGNSELHIQSWLTLALDMQPSAINNNTLPSSPSQPFNPSHYQEPNQHPSYTIHNQRSNSSNHYSYSSHNQQHNQQQSNIHRGFTLDLNQRSNSSNQHPSYTIHNQRSNSSNHYSYSSHNQQHNQQQSNIHRGFTLDLNEPASDVEETTCWPFETLEKYHSSTEGSESDCSSDTWSISSDEIIEYEWSNTYPEHNHIIECFDDNDTANHNEQTTSHNQQPRRQKYKVLNNVERSRVADILLANSHNATKLPQGMIKELAQQFGVSRWSISRIWGLVLKQYKSGHLVNVHNKKVGKVGRKRLTLDTQQLMSIPLRKRTTLRTLAHSMNMSKSTLHRLVKRGAIKAHSNAIKPDLTPTHKYQRMQWCVSAIIPGTIRTIPKFHAMYNLLHMDEKWFCMSKCTQKYYLAPEEDIPYRSCRSKKYITKLMFIGVVGRPQFGESGQNIFDGKIGIFPLTHKVAAKRSSKNRPAGTLETKAIQSITQEVIRGKLIDEVLPAIRDKWPRHVTTTVWIQQDNAKPHIEGNDELFMHAAAQTGLDIRIINQPAQSPDLNVFDLGLFTAVQSVKDQIAPKNVDELVDAVQEAYNSYSPRLINHIWLSLQYCMCEILKVKGGNNYKNPHNKKAMLERQGMLPISVDLTPQLVYDSLYWLQYGHLEDQTTQHNQAHNQEQQNQVQNTQA